MQMNKMQKLLVCILFVLFGSQASAWVSKEFIPANVSLITVTIDDQAKDGCWTNIGEVKRYTEDKLELVDFKVSREKFNTYKDKNHYLLGVKVNANRNGGKCYGVIDLTIFRGAWSNNIAGLIFVGKHGGTFSGHDNANQLALNYINFFIKQVEDPQW